MAGMGPITGSGQDSGSCRVPRKVGSTQQRTLGRQCWAAPWKNLGRGEAARLLGRLSDKCPQREYPQGSWLVLSTVRHQNQGPQVEAPRRPALRTQCLQELHGSWDSRELQRPERTVDFGL